MSTAMLPGANEPDINKGPSILAACITITTLAFIAVCTRMVVRVKMVHFTGPEDYVIILAMVLSLTGLGLIIPEVHNGAGRHYAYLDPAKAEIGLKINFITQPLYLWTITIVKVSIALFLLRIAPTKFFRRLLWGIIVFLLAYTFACFMTLLLQCKNLAVQWDPTVKTTCWTVTTLRSLSYSNASINIATDLLMAFLPIPMLWHVQISTRVKTSLVAIMSLGVFACAASMVKLSYITSYGKTGDFLFDSANLTIWTVVECNTGIIASSLPCMKPLFKRLLETSWNYGSSKNKKSNEHSLKTLSQNGIHGSKFQNISTARSTNATSMNVKRSDLTENYSEESILPLQSNSITKTTIVTVNRSDSKLVTERDLWAKKQDFAPERRIEDQV